MVDILHTIHFTSVEAYLMEQLHNDSDITCPKSIKKNYPDLYWGIDQKAMQEEITSIMESLKLLNVLSHFLYYKKDFVAVLDDTIDETLLLLKEKVEPRQLSDREAYNAIVVLIASIKPNIITDRLRPLLTIENNALTFLLQMRNTIAHRILWKEQDPFLNGLLF